MKTGKRIIVPWDFTKVAENALSHAIKMANVLDNTITLLHIAKNEKEFAGASIKLKKVVANASQNHDVVIDFAVIEGTIFTVIGEYTKMHQDINLVIMGTHGIKGLQKLTGSWALKVIVSSYAPFIIVQDPPTEKMTFGKIVFPINFGNENREKLVWAVYFGEIFNAKIHFIKQDVSDENLLKKINQNLNFASKYLSKYGIKYEISSIDKSKNFAKATVQFAKDIEADLTLIMTTKNIGALDYAIGASEQYIIANNEEIPTMCINPRKATIFSLRKF